MHSRTVTRLFDSTNRVKRVVNVWSYWVGLLVQFYPHSRYQNACGNESWYSMFRHGFYGTCPAALGK